MNAGGSRCFCHSSICRNPPCHFEQKRKNQGKWVRFRGGNKKVGHRRFLARCPTPFLVYNPFVLSARPVLPGVADAPAKRDDGILEARHDTFGVRSERRDTGTGFPPKRACKVPANLVRLPIKGIATRVIIR